jgi:crotonobetainyl-CoA:carnitine CoA-transferase CaiB-like acyl-CoA transferase
MRPLDRLPEQKASAGLGMLQGLRVLDLTTSIAGPYATQLLADLGADVTKVERAGAGDDTRGWGPPFTDDGESLWFLSVNRNKASITLDLHHREGKSIVDALIRKTDVLVLNMVAGVQTKLGLDYERLHALCPQLIHVSLTGFGLTGPRSGLPCYDLIAEGYSGVMDLTGEPDAEPQKVGTPAADLLAGQDVALATLAAVIERMRTGEGKRIDVSMVSSMVRFMAPRIVPYLGSGEPVTRSGGRDSVIAIYQVFNTADEPLTLGLGNDAIWARFWEVLGAPEFGAQGRFRTNAQRREARPEIVAVIAEHLRARPCAHWLAVFASNRIPAGPINSIDQLVKDPQLLDDGLFYTTQGPSGLVPQVGLGIRFNGMSAVHRRSPPSLGQDTENVLREQLGMSDECIGRLKNDGII